jgi:hypothetical protein
LSGAPIEYLIAVRGELVPMKPGEEVWKDLLRPGTLGGAILSCSGTSFKKKERPRYLFLGRSLSQWPISSSCSNCNRHRMDSRSMGNRRHRTSNSSHSPPFIVEQRLACGYELVTAGGGAPAFAYVAHQKWAFEG